MILSPHKVGSLNPLLDTISKEILRFEQKLTAESISNVEFQQHEKTKLLNKSMFKTGEHKELLSAYKQRSFTEYNSVIQRIYENECHSESARGGFLSKYKKMALGGTRHHKYELTGTVTYKNAIFFFGENLNPSLHEVYQTTYYPRFRAFFNQRALNSQYEFKDDSGENWGMYSWANPGFSRISNLEKTVSFVSRKYIDSHNLMSKQDLLDMIIRVELENEGSDLDDKVKKLKILKQAIEAKGENHLKTPDAIGFLRSYLTAVIENIPDTNNKIGKVALSLLNDHRYKKYKDLIDPEKRILDSQDLENFIRC